MNSLVKRIGVLGFGLNNNRSKTHCYWVRTLAIALALLSGVGHPAVAEPARSEDDALQAKMAEAGRAFVKEKCARCHAIGIDDKSPHDNAPPFRDVVTRYPSENLAEALAEGIVSGHPDMPVFVLQPDEIEGFIAFLDSLAPPAAQ
ncbi:MAG: c-type cytochrome [Hyphomicrobiaceae bacterium]